MNGLSEQYGIKSQNVIQQNKQKGGESIDPKRAKEAP